MRRAVLPIVLTAALAGAAVAAPTRPAPPPSDAALAAKLDTAAELADQNRRSEALNAQVNRKNREVQARNDAAKAAYDKAMVDYHAQIAQHDAAAAKVQADYQTSMDAWKAAVAACKAGDVAKCGQPVPAGKPPAGRPAS
jgi:hypothetical protein